MICYKDTTFCPFWHRCKDGDNCPRALTPKVVVDAALWWEGEDAPICQYVSEPECFNHGKV